MSLHDIVHLANSYGRSINNIKEPNCNFSLCIAGKPYNGVMKVLYYSRPCLINSMALYITILVNAQLQTVAILVLINIMNTIHWYNTATK